MTALSQTAEVKSSEVQINVPWISIGVVLFAFVVAAFPGADTFLEYNRELILVGGEWWRLISGIITHWSFEHLFWDTFAFLVAGALIECVLLGRNVRLKAALFFCLLMGSIFISLATLSFYPWVSNMRGLSGLCVQLYTAAAALVIFFGISHRRNIEIGIGIGAIVLLIAKLLFESLSGGAFFVHSAADDFAVLVHTHVIGGTAGIISGIYYSLFTKVQS